MKKILLLVSIFLFVFVQCSFAANTPKAKRTPKYYGPDLCANPNYDCIRLKRGGRWKKLFPNPEQRDILQRVNRTNMYLYRGKKIAIPHHLDKLTIFDVSPFSLQIKKTGEKTILIDQEKLAWAAYGTDGKMVKWGPISSGKNYCRDVKRACITVTGIFYIYHKKDKTCESNIFPVGEGGAKMPYCMFLYRGFALHGSDEVPGYRDSHGCIRLFTQDAKWLNEDFIELPSSSNHFKGTKVIIQELESVPRIVKRSTRKVKKRTRQPQARYYPRQRRAPEPRRRGWFFFRSSR